MTAPSLRELGRRERQIMDIIYRRGRATANEVMDDIADPVSNSAVRGMLRLLEGKGYLRREQHGSRYVYSPLASGPEVSRGALADVVRTFFQGSAAAAASALLDSSADGMSEDELDRLAELIDQARKGGR